MQRRRGSLHDLLRDHHFLDALKARQFEHGIEQDDLHDRPQAEMIFSRPEKAPPQTNKISVVSTCRNSCWGCLRPPYGGTEATVPSMILSSACCTPSPDTSRV